ncbi:MAG TPA: ABC transporter permease [Bacteroidetes bacterium]|nr:ABC transporter permease [Bacteroidota bacterium]
MWGSFFRMGFRVLMRQKNYFLLNLAGLTIGIVAFVFIYLYVENALYYDRSWKNYQHIYRVNETYSTGGKAEKMALTPYLLADTLKNNFPEILQSTRLFFTDPSDKNDVSSVNYRGKMYDIPNLTIGDARVFKIFNYRFTEGNPDSCLLHPNSMVLSTAMKQKIFGSNPALGKKLKTSMRQYTITGVFDNKNRPSHLEFDAVISITSLDKQEQKQLNTNWFWLNCYTYVEFADTVNVRKFTQRVNYFTDTAIGKFVQKQKIKINGYMHLAFQPIQDIHFSQGLLYDSHSNINVTYLYIFVIVALFILLMASINYVNFATARSLKRAREIGVRKVMGALRKQLMRQHISEALILTFTAFIISLSLVELMTPVFNALVNRHITLVHSLFSGSGLVFGFLLLLFMLLLALLSGSFPAFVLSSLQPVEVLGGRGVVFKTKKRYSFTAAGLRKFLVVIQYLVAIGVIISTLIIFAQIHYVKNRPLGFDKENVVVVNSPADTSFRGRVKGFVAALQADSAIEQVATASSLPGYLTGKILVSTGDSTDGHMQTLNSFFVGYHYFDLLKIPLLEGQYFSSVTENDSTEHFILNEAAVDFLHLKHPIGSYLYTPMAKKGKIIGVVKNFNFSSLHQQVEPLIFVLSPQYVQYVVVRINPAKRQEALAHLQATWNKSNKGYTMYYTFLDKKLDTLYSSDQKMLSLFFYFSLFVIFISALGLFGLSAFLIEQRSKEISIRKVLGGSEKQIVFTLVKEYVMLVLIAGLLISPVVYFFIEKWLNSFAYHIRLSIWYFVAGIVLVLFIAFFTVLLQALSMVRKRPVEALKYE